MMAPIDIWEETQTLFAEVEKELDSIRPGLSTNSAPMPSVQGDMTPDITLADHEIATSIKTTVLTPAVAHTYWYGGSSSPPGEDQPMSRNEALAILHQLKADGHDLVPCRNAPRSCPVSSFPPIVNLHQKSCPYNMIVDKSVKGSFSIFMAGTKMQPLCMSFEKDFQVQFFVRRHRDGDLRFNTFSDEKHKFSIYFISKTYYVFWKYSGSTTCDIFHMPAVLVAEHGPYIKYEIRLKH